MRHPIAIDPLAATEEIVLETCYLGRRIHGFPVSSELAPANGWVELDYDPDDPDPLVRTDDGAPLRIARYVEIGPDGVRAIPD